jgi:hypothetical protein
MLTDLKYNDMKYCYFIFTLETMSNSIIIQDIE